MVEEHLERGWNRLRSRNIRNGQIECIGVDLAIHGGRRKRRSYGKVKAVVLNIERNARVAPESQGICIGDAKRKGGDGREGLAWHVHTRILLVQNE